MHVEISKEQKEALAEKINLCVEWLKIKIQPHLTDKDDIVISMGEVLDLCLSSKDMYVRSTRWVNMGFNLPVRKVLFLVKDRKNAKKYLCDVEPELAVEFLKNWENAKAYLLKEVEEKNKKVSDFNNFVDSFKL